MGLSEFEREAKRKLEERTIVPSESAWDRLSQQLEEASVQKKKGIAWYWVAAILVVGCIAVAGIFTNTTVEQPTETTIVKTAVEKATQVEKTEQILKTVPVEKPKTVIVTDALVQTKPVIQNQVKQAEESKPVLKAKDVIQGQETPSIAETAVASVEDEKVNEVVNTLVAMQESGTEITEATIDSLLLKAQQELREERVDQILYDHHTKATTNTEALANSLLEEVEYDLDRSFKDKVFDALQDGFVKVKTAVADND